MLPRHSTPVRRTSAFTIIEMLVSVAILALLMSVLIAVTQSTSNVWTKTSAKIDEFRGAREAFETVTRQLRQATLNTYWDYDNINAPTRYIRQSELRFIAGPAPGLTQSAQTTGQAVFFQAPTGEVTQVSYEHLPSLLNTWGYFISYGDDSAQRPAFLGSAGNAPKLRHRFRLMELCEPSDSLSLYRYTNRNPSYSGTDWFTVPLKAATPPTRALTDNVVALIILPKLAAQEDATGIKLAPQYAYDSTTSNADPSINPKNQLPPCVQITLVAVDDASFTRYQQSHDVNVRPDFGVDGLFAQAAHYEGDLKELQDTLVANHLNFRVFTTTVSIKAAKWSREQVP